MASHSEVILNDFCNKAIWMDQGLIVDHGPVHEVVERYLALTPRFPEGSSFGVSQAELESA
jgi:ABC-type polysaccharide/polyol phosphate transport system ATPase subunit